ncbi:MAG: AAA family ATPase, partial [Deltaproteobacteria bacterium]|nr:AAA family ATPase [Deltaproteobacteria bacterium]
RGTGKTTMIVQHIAQKYGNSDEALYIAGDHPEVLTTGLYKIADQHFKFGGKLLCIDEIHRFPNWSQVLKSIIDVWKNKQIIVSGSSSAALHIGKGDLSRRVLFYKLHGLSFREYLNMQLKASFKSLTLNDILANHLEYSGKIIGEIEVLKHFQDYLKFGFYPFFLEGSDDFKMKMDNIIDKIITSDIPQIYNITPGKTVVLKKLLWIIASSEPFSPNISRLAKDLRVSRESIYNYLEYLTKAGLIMSVHHGGKGLRSERKPEKVYLDNTNLLDVLSSARGRQQMRGTVRETFFANQVRAEHQITIPSQGDFAVDGKFLFEIGGKNKSSGQLPEGKDSFYVLDSVETGFRQKMPLYLFGFLY